MSQQQGFQSADPMQSYSRQELFGLQTSMERLGFPPKQTSSFEQQREKDPSLNPSIASSSSWRTAAAAAAAVGDEGGGAFFPKASPADPSTHYYDTNEWVQPFHPLLPSAETNQLSLSLFDTNPRASDVAMEGQQLQQVEHREEWFQQQQPYQEIRRSKYLVPTQDLLNEFCSIESSHDDWKKSRKKSKGVDQWEEVGASSSSCSWNQTFQSMDVLELQRRKARLLFMLEEVERRYRRYCEQMRSVVAGFEAVAGEGSSAVYAAMARKAMSRHFRCLRDGIVGQLKGTKKAMGEKEGSGGAPGATRGETPRLKVLDQSLRQQKLLHHGGIMESHPWRPQRGLPERSVSILRAWLFEHFLHPYPSDVDKHILARQTGLTRSQVSNWFINARVRLWKPMVEEMYLEETRDVENHQFSSTSTTQHDLLISPTNPNPSLPHTLPLQEQKPDSDFLSSVIIGATSLDVRDLYNHHHQQLVDVDFPSYGGNGHEQSFSNNNVSLTLGLQQHDGTGGRGLSYPPAAMAVASTSQNSMFFGREPVQFTALEGDHGQNMSHPYRNLMGAHLLHDLAG